MLNFFRRKAKVDIEDDPYNDATSSSSSEVKPKETGSLNRLTSGLKRTRSKLTVGLSSLILGKKVIDNALLEEIESLLLSSDIGVDVTEEIIGAVTQSIQRDELSNPAVLFEQLRTHLESLLTASEAPLSIDTTKKPYVILMVGVNGAGKTTTIGKLAARLQADGKTVLLAAGDTFRAAAIEQLQAWGKIHNTPVIAQQTGSDSASVIFDALQSARSQKVDVVIADTAGRLHTKANLMEELKKITRVLKKLDQSAPHEIMLVLDATTGQNALRQAQAFHEAIGITSLVITKLDGTAKGGMVFAVAKALKIPIRYIGVGEAAADLQPFSAKKFVHALFDD